MHPPPFEYHRAESVPDALRALAGDPEARVLAGGQSLIPMMSLGVAAPTLLVDINALALSGLEQANGRIRIGALTRHREFELSRETSELLPLASEAARSIGSPRVRNRGTFGGSLCHADPAAELAAVALAHEGSVTIENGDGSREVAIDEFFHGFFETAVAQGELLTAATLDRPADGSGTAFVEVAQRADDFAVAAAATILTPDRTGRMVADVRLALAGVGPAPARCFPAEGMCAGEQFDTALLDRVRAAVVDWAEPEDDPFVGANYRRHVAGVCARRALATAWARSSGRPAGA